MASIRMPQTLPRIGVSTGSQPGRQAGDSSPQRDLLIGEIAAKEAAIREKQRAANEKKAMEGLAEPFASAVKVWGGQLAYAARLGVDKSVVSDMAAGKRIIGPRDWFPLMEEPAAWAVWMRGVAGVGGLDVSVYHKPVMTMAMLRDRIVEVVIEDARRGGLLGETVLSEVARREQVERADIDAVLERGEDDVAGEEELPAGSLT